MTPPPDDDGPDFEPVDDNGLTAEQSAAWRSNYVAIAHLINVAVSTAPTVTEAHRRIGLVMLELRTHAAAVDMLAPTWTNQPPAQKDRHAAEDTEVRPR